MPQEKTWHLLVDEGRICHLIINPIKHCMKIWCHMTYVRTYLSLQAPWDYFPRFTTKLLQKGLTTRCLSSYLVNTYKKLTHLISRAIQVDYLPTCKLETSCSFNYLHMMSYANSKFSFCFSKIYQRFVGPSLNKVRFIHLIEVGA